MRFTWPPVTDVDGVVDPLTARLAGPATGPVCRVLIDLLRLPALPRPESVVLLLRRIPGVIDVQVDLSRRRAVVLHDSRTSLPVLWNALCRYARETPERGGAGPNPGRVADDGPPEEDGPDPGTRPARTVDDDREDVRDRE